MFEQAMEVMADRVGQQVGEIERFLEVSKTFMDSIDLQNGVFEEEGMEMLEKWEKESSLILGADKQLLIDMEAEHLRVWVRASSEAILYRDR